MLDLAAGEGGQKARLWFAVGFWDLWTQARLASLTSEASGQLDEGGPRKFAKAPEMERTRL